MSEEGFHEMQVVSRAEARVRGHLQTRIRGFSLAVQGNGLVLRGLTHTYYAKQLAQHAVMQAVGLPILANEIQVTPPRRERVTER